MRTLPTILLMLTVFAGTLQAQISPGELSASHELLEGVGNCTACHERGAEVSTAKCLECHTNIRTLIGEQRGLHFKNAKRACVDCHKEHLGKNAPITKFSEGGFDHAQAGFVLAGRHQPLACAKCHSEPTFQVDKAALPKSAGKKTFLGLDNACSSCHADRHGGTLTQECQRCHTTDGWTPATGFDHAKAKFTLVGLHAPVLCVKCHVALGTKLRPTPLVFTVKSPGDCASCHKSPHRAGFSTRQCSECHNPTGWKSTASFDHSTVRFPLVGKHLAVACEKCHTAMHAKRDGMKADFTTKTFADCTPCHKSPHMEGMSKLACTSCHTSNGWRAVDVRQFNHGLTGFVLRGKHGALACRSCHESKGGQTLAVIYQKGAQRCATCHEDYHRGAFKERYNDCAQCHTETSFSPSTFTVAQHEKARFPLGGAHRAVLCIECHKKQAETTLFTFASVTCTACHKDQHNGAFDKLMGNDGCAYCHGTDSWKRVRFDHSRVGFSLAGRHSVVVCSQCHKSEGGTVRYRGTPKACQSCHADVHGGQFSQAGGVKCESCHTPNSWRMVIFDHEKQSEFHLTGAHKNIPCGACHKHETVAGGTLVRFKPLPKKCEACHRGGK